MTFEKYLVTQVVYGATPKLNLAIIASQVGLLVPRHTLDLAEAKS